ncbi:class I SAM-dependent methyltransferase [uncultured Arcticibacterium sp.]|uniref:O-methyltransferase n=1 Tax=uncultured Arcticibacterium sp. TaxID=2173042 RepID=UPI0030F4FC5C
MITNTINELFNEAKHDGSKIIKGIAKSILRPIKPSDFKDAYLSISREQGEDLVQLIRKKNLKNIVEFGTSFGISTLFLAQGVRETKGKIVTTELIESKATKAIEHFKKAGVNDLIEVRVGDATDTLKEFSEPIDLLLLDGWKDLYLPIFRMLEGNFHAKTLIYVDNADMRESKDFLATIAQNEKYQLESQYQGKVVLISVL